MRDAELGICIRNWIAKVWPFDKVAYPSRDMSWTQWRSLPQRRWD